MRLPPEKIKEAILHSDQRVREAAAYYFSRSFSTDPEIMPLAIRAIEQHGLDAFSMYTFMSELVQTDDTVAWLIQEMQRLRHPSNEDEELYIEGLVAALRNADDKPLKKHEMSIQKLANLDDNSKRAVAETVFLSSFTFDQLWQELVEFCEEEDDAEDAGEDLSYPRAVVVALAKFPEQATKKVLEVLSDEKEEGWLEVMVIRLAGLLRLEAAVPRLFDSLVDFETWDSEEANPALVRIGNDTVVREALRRLGDGDWDHRLTAACLLEDIHTDLSVATCLQLLKKEQDEALRGHWLQALLANFCSEGIEPARQHILVMPKSPDLLEVRSDLLVCSMMLGQTFPEFEKWLEESNHDVEFRRQWYKDHPLHLPDFDEDLEDDIDFGDDFEEDESQPIVRETERVGRNDPCPCGSGKKYKKCCYGKETGIQASDDIDSGLMSTVFHGNQSEKFPVGTLAFYGPNDRTTTKIVAGVVKRAGGEPILERWVGTNIKDNPKVKRQVRAFFQQHRVTQVAASERNIGCPHEEGLDFPTGEDCPFCPYWAGKQGSNRRD